MTIRKIKTLSKTWRCQEHKSAPMCRGDVSEQDGIQLCNCDLTYLTYSQLDTIIFDTHCNA